MRSFKLTENSAYKQKFSRLFYIPLIPLHSGKEQNKNKNKNKYIIVFYVSLIPLSDIKK